MIITITDLIGKEDRVELRDVTVVEEKKFFLIIPAGIEDHISVGKGTFAGRCIEWGLTAHPEAASFDMEITRIKKKMPHFYVRMMARGAQC